MSGIGAAAARSAFTSGLVLVLGLAPVAVIRAAQPGDRPAPPAAEALAAPGRPGWTVDAATGCWLWNAEPRPGETARWTGGCADGRAEGTGTAEWRHEADGRAQVTRYAGPLRDGRPEGWGVVTRPGGARYEGEWRGGRPDGMGLMVLADGASYEGAWRDGRRNGRGVATLPGGERYVGTWRDGTRDGWGVATSPGGTRYEGEWRGGRQNGRGTLVLPDGARYEGGWRDGLPDGPGELHTATGSHRGVWREGCLARGDRPVAAVGRPIEECGRGQVREDGGGRSRPAQPRSPR
jgi:hypothetical protein